MTLRGEARLALLVLGGWLLSACAQSPEPAADLPAVSVVLWLDGFERSPSPDLTSLAATRLTGVAPADHGLFSARDLGAHRLSPEIGTHLEAFAEEGGHPVVALSSPRLAHELTGLWRGVDPPDRLEPSWRASSVARSPRETIDAAIARLTELGSGEDARPILLLIQIECPPLRRIELLPAAQAFLEAELERLEANASESLAGQVREARKLAAEQGLGAFHETYARRRGSSLLAALEQAHTESWRAEVLERLRSAGLSPTRNERRHPLDRRRGPGHRLHVPPLPEPRVLVLESDESIFSLPGELPATRLRLELPASEQPSLRLIASLARAAEIRLRLVPAVGASFEGASPSPEPTPQELGFSLSPLGPPLEPVPTDPEVREFLLSLPSVP